MSWKLREYFVATEHIIKEYDNVPLFSSLTMTDDLATLTKKLMDQSGAKADDYESVGKANS